MGSEKKNGEGGTSVGKRSGGEGERKKKYSKIFCKLKMLGLLKQ